MIELENHAEAAVAQPVALGGAEIVDPPPFEVDLAVIGNVERAQQMQECRFPAAALADNGQELTLPHGQAHAAKHRHLDRAFAIVLLQPFGQQLWRSARRVLGHDEARGAPA